MYQLLFSLALWSSFFLSAVCAAGTVVGVMMFLLGLVGVVQVNSCQQALEMSLIFAYVYAVIHILQHWLKSNQPSS